MKFELTNFSNASFFDKVGSDISRKKEFLGVYLIVSHSVTVSVSQSVSEPVRKLLYGFCLHEQPVVTIFSDILHRAT